MPQKYRAVVFDAYGTLIDVHSVLMRVGAGIAGDLNALSQLWRQKQLEFTWLRALMDRYQDFWQITEAALRTAAAQLKIETTDSDVERLMDGYLSAGAFLDARAAIDALRGIPLAILSNGTPQMLDAAVRGAGLTSCFSSILSADQVKTYKPSARVYALGPATFCAPTNELLFVSSNPWDAAGAKAFGYSVCWCNRSGQAMDQLGFPPDFIVSSLDQIPAHL